MDHSMGMGMGMENAFYSSSEVMDFLFKGFTVTSLPGFIGVLVGIASVCVLYEGIRQVRDFFLNRFADTRKQALIYQQQQQQQQQSTDGGQQQRKRSRRGSDGNGGSSTKRCDSIRYFNINKKSPIEDIGHDNEIGTVGPGGDAPSSVVINGERESDVSPDPEPGPSSALVPRPAPQVSNVRVRVEDLVLATLLHMVYITIGYLLMLAVMTFNVWILVSVSIGIGIGYLIFGTFRRLDYLATHKRITIIECCEEGGGGDNVAAGRSHRKSGGHSAREESVGPEGPLLRSGTNSCSSSQTSDTATGRYGATTAQFRTSAVVTRDDEDENPVGEENRTLMSRKGEQQGACH